MISGYEPTQVYYHPRMNEIILASSYKKKDPLTHMESISLYVAVYWNENEQIIPFWELEREFELIGEF